LKGIEIMGIIIPVELPGNTHMFGGSDAAVSLLNGVQACLGQKLRELSAVVM
jgi:hypothetical protein